MILCFNPTCANPKNPDHHRFCQTCGGRLQLGDRYEAVYSLGAGQNSHTFVGRDRATLVNAQCLIKQFTPVGATVMAKAAAAERFRKEVEHLAIASHHPQIPDLFAYFERDNQQFLVQQFLVGPQLEQRLQEKLGPFDSDEVYAFLRNVLPILHHLHHHRLIHRDIKPTNFRQPPGQSDWWLVDFGAIKPVTATHMAKPGTLIGSADYAAPEQLRGEATYASDVYSLGVVCLHLLTYLQPFDLFDSVNGCWQWRSIVPDVDPDLAALIDHMVQPTLRDRPPDVATVMASLGLDLPTTPESRSPGPNSAHPWQPASNYHLGAPGSDLVLPPPSQQLIVLSPDGTLWGRSLAQPAVATPPLQPEPAHITAIATHPQDPMLVTGDRQGQLTLWLWQAAAWQAQPLGTLNAAITALLLSPTGTELFIGDDSGQIHQWDWQTGERRSPWRGHDAKITCLALNGAGNLLASGDTQGSLKIWDGSSATVLRTLSRQPGGLTAIAWLPGDAVVVTAGWDVTLRWRCPQTGGHFHTAKAEGFYLPVRSLLAHPTEPWVVSGSQDGHLQLWESRGASSETVTTGSEVVQVAELGAAIVALRSLPDATHFLSLTAAGQLTHWPWPTA